MTERGNKKTLIGLVASDKMEKTVVVEVPRRMKHPMYHKYIQRRKRYHAHDEANDCRTGAFRCGIAPQRPNACAAEIASRPRPSPTARASPRRPSSRASESGV